MINDNQDIQEIESFIEEFTDERKVDEKTDEARGNDELIRNDAQGILHIVEKLEKDGKKYEIGDVVNAFEHLRKEDKKKDEIPKVVDKVDDGNEEDRISDEMLDEGIQKIQYILDKSKEEGKAYEWNKIVSTLEYLSKGRKDESEDDDDDVFIEEEVDKRSENKKESGSKISTEKEDKGNKNKTNKRTLKKGKRKISEIYLCAVCNKSITSTSIPCKACLNYVHLSRCTNYKDAKDAQAHGEFYRCPNCVKNDISIQITREDKTEKRKPGRPRIQTSPGEIRRTSLSDLTRKRKKTEYEGLPNKLSPLNKRNRIQRKEKQDKNKLDEKQEDQTKSIENNVETKKNESYNVLTFEDGMLTKEDVDSLNDGKCLTDATISFAFAQIEKEKRKELEENNIQLVRPEVAMVLKRGDKSQVLETKRV